jgi:uncharacterized membrane protein
MRLDSVDVTEPIGAAAQHQPSGPSDARGAIGASRVDGRPATIAVLLATVALLAVTLRVLMLGRYTLTFDESFTAMGSRRSVDSMLSFLRYHDAHPPLDYLLRKPLADAGVTNGWFRAPSVLCSIAAFFLFAAWMWRRGVMGLCAIAFMAVAPFQLVFGREARMYAAVVLVGVVCAVAADRWLRRPDRAVLVVVGVALLVGLFEYTPVAFLALGLFTLPVLRRDADAWKWRAAVTAPVIVWAATWGPSMIEQWRAEPASWIPYTTPASFTHAVGGLVTFAGSTELLMTAAVLVGGIVLWHSDRRLARVWIACFTVPLVLAAGVGLVSHSFLSRTLAFGAWAPLVALAALVEQAARRWRVLGIASALIIIELMAGSAISAVVAPTEEYGALQRVDRLGRVGDAVAVTPKWFRPLIDWNLGVHGPGAGEPLSNRFLRARDGYAFVLGPARWDGRVWLVEKISYFNDVSGVPRCEPDWHDTDWRVFCLEPGRHP